MGIHFERKMLQAMRQGVLSTDATGFERKYQRAFFCKKVAKKNISKNSK